MTTGTPTRPESDTVQTPETPAQLAAGATSPTVYKGSIGQTSLTTPKNLTPGRVRIHPILSALGAAASHAVVQAVQ